jgi:hypothetical protein
MVDFCEGKGVPFFVHENWRWQRPIRALHDVLKVQPALVARRNCDHGVREVVGRLNPPIIESHDPPRTVRTPPWVFVCPPPFITFTLRQVS